MKEVFIIVRPNRYYKTKKALSDNRFFAMSTKEVLGRGRASVKFESRENDVDSKSDEVYENAFVAKKMIEMIVPDEAVEPLIKLILEINSSGSEGDGKIFVIPVEDSIRIHTGETGEDALI